MKGDGVMRFAVQDPFEGDTYFETKPEAIVFYQKTLDEYAEHASSDGWVEEIESLRIIEVVAVTEKFNEERRPDDCDEDGFSVSTDRYWPGEWDYICQYRLKEIQP